MPDLWMDVDAAVIVPVNLLPLLDDTTFKDIEIAVVYNSAGLAITWNFVTTAGVVSGVAVTPTTGGVYDWSEPLADVGMYAMEIPASGGASANNDTEGFGWITGVATGVLPWRGPVIGFRAVGLNNALIDSAYSATQGLAGTDLDANIAGVETKIDTIDGIVDDILVDTTEIGAAGVGLTEAGGDGDHLTEAGGTGDHLTAITDEIDDATVSILAGQSAVLTNSGLVLNTTTIATLASQTSFTLTAGSADDDAYNGCILVIRDSVAPTSICFGKVLDYTGSSKTVTLEEDPGIFTFGVGDRACVLAPDAVAAMFDGVVTNAALDTDLDTYQAIVSMSIENGTNHYAVDFAKNGEPIRSGITSPQIQVIKCADGTDLIALDDLTEIDSDGRYKYDESSNIIVAGKMYNLDVTATIGGATRTWGYHMWRDA